MSISKIAAFMALLLGIGLMVYAGGQLLAIREVYQEGSQAYEALNERVKVSGQAALPIQGPQENHADTQNAQANTPAHSIDFAALKTINEDAAAWLFSPGTAIDYPVIKADDYSYYIDRLPDGTKNANGSLFIDYNNAADFSGPLTVIYGHHMKSGKMFGSLKGYKEQGYYEKHPQMYLFTEQGGYQIELLYGCIIDAGQWRERAFMYAENVESLLAYAAHHTTFTSAAKYTEGDKILALSTCSYKFDHACYVMLGILK